MQFTYKARDIKGHSVDGTIEADARSIVVDRLRQQGLIPISITEGRSAKAAAASLDNAPRAKKISVKELSLLSRQLATMIQAGLPLVSALNVLAAQIDKKSVAAVVNDVRKRV
ncbi:MAG TPA: type II secretion system F family protein, partial [Bacillota bacterium]|nr:type II secretion system F family protein [Bacillota bacterium]